MTWIPPVIAKDNDLTFEVGPIRGRNPTNNVIEDWTGTTVSGWITTDPVSDVPIGGVTAIATVSAAATFVPSFQASDVNTILAAAGGLTDEMPMYFVYKGAGDFRRYKPLVYRTALDA